MNLKNKGKKCPICGMKVTKEKNGLIVCRYCGWKIKKEDEKKKRSRKKEDTNISKMRKMRKSRLPNRR